MKVEIAVTVCIVVVSIIFGGIIYLTGGTVPNSIKDVRVIELKLK